MLSPQCRRRLLGGQLKENKTYGRLVVGSARSVEEKQHQAPELPDMKHRGVDEVDVYRNIRRVRLGQRAVVRVVINPGGNAGDKAPPSLEWYRIFL